MIFCKLEIFFNLAKEVKLQSNFYFCCSCKSFTFTIEETCLPSQITTNPLLLKAINLFSLTPLFDL